MSFVNLVIYHNRRWSVFLIKFYFIPKKKSIILEKTSIDEIPFFLREGLRGLWHPYTRARAHSHTHCFSLFRSPISNFSIFLRRFIFSLLLSSDRSFHYILSSTLSLASSRVHSWALFKIDRNNPFVFIIPLRRFTSKITFYSKCFVS